MEQVKTCLGGYMSKIGELGKKVEFVLKNEGVGSVVKKSYTYVKLTGARMTLVKYLKMFYS